jgi:hypothetical protein
MKHCQCFPAPNSCSTSYVRFRLRSRTQGLLRPTTTVPSSSSSVEDKTKNKQMNMKKKQYHFKAPILWNLQPWSILTELHDHAFVDVGGMFSGNRGVGRATTREDIDKMPYAMRYMKCDPALDNAYCKAMEYNSTCWIHPSVSNGSNSSSSKSKNDNRIPIPSALQREYPGGRAKWHPGFRKHQLTGRVLTMTILRALYEALVTWQKHHQDAIAAAAVEKAGHQVQDSTTSFLLPSDYWHVSGHYQRIQAALTEVATATTATTVTNTNDDKEPVTPTTSSPKFTSPCFELADKIPARVCQLSLRVSGTLDGSKLYKTFSWLVTTCLTNVDIRRRSHSSHSISVFMHSTLFLLGPPAFLKLGFHHMYRVVPNTRLEPIPPVPVSVP